MIRLTSYTQTIKSLVSVAILIIFSFLAGDALGADSKYVMIGPNPICSIIAGKNSEIKSFHMLIPTSTINDIASNRGIIKIHVCECLLSAGDQSNCAAKAILRKVTPIKLTKNEESSLHNRIFIRIHDQKEFINLLKKLELIYPYTQAPNEIFDKTNVGTSTVSLKADNNSLPPSGPPTPPIMTGQRHPDGNNGGEQEEDKDCELEPNICINPNTLSPTVEVEMKCKGFPPIVFSSEIKAGFKLGFVEIAVSAEGVKKKEEK